MKSARLGFSRPGGSHESSRISMTTLRVLAANLMLGVAVYAAPLGLQVQNGALMKAGQPYQGIGANYFSLFARLIQDPTDTSSLSNLTALAQAHIPFVRFMGCGFWPKDWQLYLTNRPVYFQRMDMVVRCAETNGVGLIPSLFWHLATVSDLVGEHLDELGNPQSKTIAFIRSYTGKMVTRYKDSPAIWGWEFANECNLSCDLPNAASHRPAIVPQRGTPASRSERDELKFTQLCVALSVFAETVRKFDRTRIIISGNSIPRASAWHNMMQKTWTADTAAQFSEILLRDNPDPLDTICIHLYPEKKGGYPGGAPDIGKVMALAHAFAQQARKPLFIGEFGVARQAGPHTRQQAVFAEILEAIAKERVPLAAFWVFDLPMQDKDWNVTFDNDRAWMLDAITQANARLKKEGP